MHSPDIIKMSSFYVSDVILSNAVTPTCVRTTRRTHSTSGALPRLHAFSVDDNIYGALLQGKHASWKQRMTTEIYLH